MRHQNKIPTSSFRLFWRWKFSEREKKETAEAAASFVSTIQERITNLFGLCGRQMRMLVSKSIQDERIFGKHNFTILPDVIFNGFINNVFEDGG